MPNHTKIPRPGSALVLLGHGSTLNPDSSAPVLRLADRIRNEKLFREVVCAFWKEQPSFTDLWHSLDSDEIFLVPIFISEGYFCQDVLPRELGLTGPITQKGNATLKYCRPIGTHPAMSDLLLTRAAQIAPNAPREKTTLFIVGHGTNLNENSKSVVQEQTARVRNSGAGYAHVLDAYMEEAPFIAHWDHLTDSPNVVVTPFFISDGLHSYQDIPVLLGLETEPTAAASQRSLFRHNPRHIRGRDLYYSGAIGADPGMIDLILAQIDDFHKEHPEAPPSPPHTRPHRLDTWLDHITPTGAKITLSQLSLSKTSPTTWQLTHRDDLGKSPTLLQHLSDIDQFRNLIFFNTKNEYRPLKSSPDLPTGWIATFTNTTDLRVWLEEAQPGQLALTLDAQTHHLNITPLRTFLKRQTGMYNLAHTLSPAGAAHLISTGPCAPNNCVRHIAWPTEPTQPSPPLPLPTSDTWICREPCAILLATARETARAEEKKTH